MHLTYKRTKNREGNLIRYPLFLIFFMILSGCGDDRTGINVSIPEDTEFAWNYRAQSYYQEDTTTIGSVTLENFETQDLFQARQNILRQRIIRRIDSLSNTSDSVSVTSTFLDLSNNFRIELFAEDYFDLFQTMLTRRAIDTLGNDSANGPDFQELLDFNPLWSSIAKFDETSNANFEVHRPFTLFLNFSARDFELIGSAEVLTTGFFSGFETINTPFRDSLSTIKIRNTTRFDMNLEKISQANDTTSIPEFRVTLDMLTWYTRENGIVRKDRKPFALHIPSIPSRFPLVLDRGELWELTGVEGFDFGRN